MVPPVIEAMVVFPVVAPVMLPAMFGPVTNMPGHKPSVLSQVTMVVPSVAHDVRTTGRV